MSNRYLRGLAGFGDFSSQPAVGFELGQIRQNGKDPGSDQKMLLFALVLKTQELRHSRNHRAEASLEPSVHRKAERSFSATGITRQQSKTQSGCAAKQTAQRCFAVVVPEPSSGGQERSCHRIIHRKVSIWGDEFRELPREYIGCSG